jgi:prepilin-type N-terminal cleavage/methylation domain-containing protein
MTKRKGFTLIELMVVVLIVGILAAASIPLMRGRIDSAKWSEANATAGTIKSAVRVYFSETSGDTTKINAIKTALSTSSTQTALGFSATDLEGTYFTAADYTITNVDTDGNATITVKTSKANAPQPVGTTKTLSATGVWQ